MDTEGNPHYLPPQEYVFNLDNSFTDEVPEPVWAELENAYLDNSIGLRYRDALKPL